MGIDKLDHVSTDVPGSGSDSLSRKEEKQFTSDSKRWDEKQQHFHYVFIGAMWVCAAVLAVIFIIRMTHFVLPDGTSAGTRAWLSKEQIEDIDKFLFHGTIGALIVGFGKGLLSSKAPKGED